MPRGRRSRPGDHAQGKDSERHSARRERSVGPATPTRPAPSAGPGLVTLWGRHAVAAALANERRSVVAIHGTAKTAATLASLLGDLPPARGATLPEPTTLEIKDLSDKVPFDAVHQGLVVIARPLEPRDLEVLLDQLSDVPDALLVVLDQVTDPHNVGAVLRSAAAFGAAGVIVQSRRAPPADGVLAKSASGALDLVPIIEVTNIARAIDTLKDGGFWCVGLSGDGEATIGAARLDGKLAMVLGAEGPGLRRLPTERCDIIVRLPTESDFATLNISNAAAVALYEARRRQREE